MKGDSQRFHRRQARPKPLVTGVIGVFDPTGADTNRDLACSSFLTGYSSDRSARLSPVEEARRGPPS
jgi:hypothetical protein